LDLCVQPAPPAGRAPDQPAPAVAAFGDLTGAVRLDPGPQHVGKTEFARRPQCLDVIDLRGRGGVVLGEPGVEGHPCAAGDRFRWDPGDRGDAALVSHTAMIMPAAIGRQCGDWRLSVCLPPHGVPYARWATS